jgi:polyhydroxybutyrate depolymerase
MRAIAAATASSVKVQILPAQQALRRRSRRLLSAAVRSSFAFTLMPLLLAAACSSSGKTTAGATDAGDEPDAAILGEYDPTPFGGSRPVSLYVPSGYTGAPTPLLILLHGYSANGAEEDLYLGMRSVAESKNVLYAHPDGTIDSAGEHFWNATDACCNFDGSTVDDSGYLAGLVQEIGTRYSVDPKRVFFFGHSNGGFMSYRMACDHADLIAGIVSIAGEMWADTTKCPASGPVSVLEVQGTADQTVSYTGEMNAPVSYDGGLLAGTYPGAAASVADWATIDGCTTPPDTSQPNLDLDSSLPGAETQVTQYLAGCKSGTQANLWSIQGGMHVPGFSETFAPMALDFLLAHPKP